MKIRYYKHLILLLSTLFLYISLDATQIKPKYTVPRKPLTPQTLRFLKNIGFLKILRESQKEQSIPLPEASKKSIVPLYIAPRKKLKPEAREILRNLRQNSIKPLGLFYNHEKKELTVKNDISDITKKEDPQKIESSFVKNFENVSSYQYSPNKQYILLTKEIITDTSKTAYAKEKTKEVSTLPFIGKYLQEGITSATKSYQKFFELFNTKTLKNIPLPAETTNALFYQFSPQSKALLLATRVAIDLMTALTDKNAVQATLQYHLLDNESGKIIKTFSNVKRMGFLTEESLLLENHNGVLQKVTFTRKPDNTFLSMIKSWINSFDIQITNDSSLQIPGQTIVYDPIKESLIITTDTTHTFDTIKSYSLSPSKKFVLAIQKNTKTPETLLINTQTSTIVRNIDDVINYEFNQNESRLIVLAKEKIKLGIGNAYRYQFINTNTGKKILLNPAKIDIQSLFFDQNQDLVVISNDIKTIYNPKSGKSYRKEKEQKEMIEPLEKWLLSFFETDDISQENVLPLLYQKDKEFSKSIKHFSPEEQQSIMLRQKEFLTRKKPQLRKILKAAIQKKLDPIIHKPILEDIGKATLAGMISAANSLAQQALKVGTGNLPSLNPTQLLIAALNSVFLNVTNTLVKKEFTALAITQILPAISATTITQSIIQPSLEGSALHIIIPSMGGIFQSWLLMETLAIINETVQEHKPTIQKALNSINIQEVLLGGKTITPPSELNQTLLAEIHDIVNNEIITQIILQVGTIVFESAVLGAVLHSLGFGYVTPSKIEAIKWAILNGVAQGTLAYIATLSRKQEPGALLNIVAEPLLLTAAGYSPSTAAAASIQAITNETVLVVNIIIQKNGGFYQTLQQGKSALRKTIASRWGETWKTIEDNINIMDPIEINMMDPAEQISRKKEEKHREKRYFLRQYLKDTENIKKDFYQVLQQGKKTIEQTVFSSWGLIWTTIVNGWETIKKDTSKELFQKSLQELIVDKDDYEEFQDMEELDVEGFYLPSQ